MVADHEATITDDHIVENTTTAIKKLKEYASRHFAIASDGAMDSSKSRFSVLNHLNLVNDGLALCVTAFQKPTGTYKGNHDGIGQLDKIIIRGAMEQGFFCGSNNLHSCKYFPFSLI